MFDVRRGKHVFIGICYAISCKPFEYILYPTCSVSVDLVNANNKNVINQMDNSPFQSSHLKLSQIHKLVNRSITAEVEF